VGALTSRDFRFQKRVWMLKATESVCPGCATGCNVRVDHEAGRIYRLKPRYNPAVNGRWMCDRGRMVYKGVHDEKRLTDPAVGGETLTWADATLALRDLLGGAAPTLGVASPHQSLEEMHQLRALAAAACGDAAAGDTWEGDEILIDADRTPNRGGLRLLGLAETGAAELAAKIAGAGGVVVILGGDPAADPAVAEAVRSHGRVVYVGTHANETSGAAHVVLPGATWAEKAGTFVNRQGRLQNFRQAVARAGNAREDWRILAELRDLAGGEAPGSLKAVRTAAAADLGLAADLNALPAEGFLPGGEA
jgi:NADH-quinone oxidoreductase subunit G